MKQVIFISLIAVLFIGCSNDKTGIDKKSLHDSFFVRLTFSLLIINFENQKSQKKITGKEEKNFVIIGNLLI